MQKCIVRALNFVLAVALAGVAGGQTFTSATGSGSVAKPGYPTVMCPTFRANLTPDSNGDAPGGLVSDPTTTSALQTALNACVPMTGTASLRISRDLSTPSKSGIVMGPIVIPSKVTLLVDPEITIWASLAAADYQNPTASTKCGRIDTSGTTGSPAGVACMPLIQFATGTPGAPTFGAHDAGLMGYGLIDMRGDKTFTPQTGVNGLSQYAYTCQNLHGNTFSPNRCCKTTNLSWWDLGCQNTQNNANGLTQGYQENPRAIFAARASSTSLANNITIAGVTIKNAPFYNIITDGVTNFIVWGIKIVGPGSKSNVFNTDGVDPGGVSTGTLAYNWISTGDDDVAITAHNNVAQNISVVNNHIFDGHGESIGSQTLQGVTNVLFDNNVLFGDANFDHSDAIGINIKSDRDRANTITQITYSNSCFANHQHSIQFNPLESGTDTKGTGDPSMTDIMLTNLTFDVPSANIPAFLTPSTAGLTPSARPLTGATTVEFDGYKDVTSGVTFPLNLKMNQVDARGMTWTYAANADASWAGPAFTQLYQGTGYVDASLRSLLISKGATYTGGGTGTEPTDACVYDFLAGDFALLGGEDPAYSWQRAAISLGGSVKVKVQLQPAIANTIAIDQNPAVNVPMPTGTIYVKWHTSGTTLTSASIPAGSAWTDIDLSSYLTTAKTYTFDVFYGGDGNYTYAGGTKFIGTMTIVVS